MRSPLAAVLLIAACPTLVHADTKPVTVLSITDAQQVLVELEGMGRSVRLACLQAPRSSQLPWAARSLATMRALIERGDRAQFELRSRDVYGRLVGRLLIDGKDLGGELVRRGAVFAWDGYLGRCDDLRYDRLEQKARSEAIGVWSASPPLQRPWNVMETKGGEP